jgi:hypothetical protein
MPNLCISNLVYGQPYTNIFLNYHLKSLFENIDGDDFSNSHYLIFTDQTHIPIIEAHENYKKLEGKLIVRFIIIEGAVYNARYQIQSAQANWTAKFALEKNLILHLTSADTYYGKGIIKSALNFLSNGYDSVVNQPMRITYESAAQHLSNQVLSVDELFEVGFSNLHPLWTSSNWENPYFTLIPYQLIWSDEKSICLRPFSLGVSFAIPQEWMLKVQGCFDMTYISHCKNPYYSTDWSELPMVELQPLLAMYPPFGNKRSDIQAVTDWAFQNIHPDNFGNLSRYIIYKKINDPINEELIFKSKLISDILYTYLSALNLERILLTPDRSLNN